MKRWTGDLVIGVVAIMFMGASLFVVETFSSFLFWFAGLASGYGLRIGVVNVWPHIFRPRLAYTNRKATADALFKARGK